MTQPDRREISVAVLAGGQGTRLRPLTTVFPKPLVPLADKPIIEILLRRLAAQGFRRVTLCTGYLAELIRAVCADGSQFGLSIDYVNEPRRLGTAGPLGLVPGLSDPFLVMNGDLLTTLDFGAMLDTHRGAAAAATMAIARRCVNIDFGVIESGPDGRFQKYVEKPTIHYDVSMGAYVLARRVLRHVESGVRLDMPELISRVAAAGDGVSCYRSDCHWLDIGRMDDYALAQEQYARDPDLFLGTAP
jgi:NDP-mannose synthase